MSTWDEDPQGVWGNDDVEATGVILVVGADGTVRRLLEVLATVVLDEDAGEWYDPQRTAKLIQSVRHTLTRYPETFDRVIVRHTPPAPLPRDPQTS